MLDINVYLVVAQVLTFLAGLALLWKVAYKPLTVMLQQRADKIRDDLDAAAEARQGMEKSKVDLDLELKKLREQAQDMIQQAIHAGQKERDAIMSEARTQSQEVLKRAEERIEIEKQKALKELRREVIDLTLLVSERVIGAGMTSDTQRRLVDQAVTQLEAKS